MGAADNRPVDGSVTQASGAAPMRVFLSYSRKDGDFVARLAEALTGAGFEAAYDASPHAGQNPELGIAADDEWWKQLERMIAAADAVVFVVTPDAAASKVCDEEIAYARHMGKRVIAILRREIDFAKAPPRLAALNVKLRFLDDGAAGFAASLAELVAALELDAAWWREQSWLAGQVKTWADAEDGKRGEWLLSVAELERAERWASRRPPKAPPASEAELDFLAASRTRLAKLAEEERRKLRVRQWLQLGVLGLTVVALGVTLAGAWFVTQGQRDLARRASAALAAAAATEFDAGQYDRALRLAILAGRETWLTPVASEAAFEIGRAAEFSRAVLRLPGAERSCSALADDGRAVATVEDGRLVLLQQDGGGTWTRQELGVAASRTAPESGLMQTARACGAFAPDGSWFAGLGAKGEIVVWAREGAGWRRAFAAAGQDGWLVGMKAVGADRLLTWGEAGATLWRAEGAGWTQAHVARPERGADPSQPQPGSPYGGAVSPLLGIYGADVSADGTRMVMLAYDQRGSGVVVATRRADGAWETQALAGAQRSIDDVQVSPQGRRLLVTGDSLARVFEVGADGAWRMIAQEGQAPGGRDLIDQIAQPPGYGMPAAPGEGQPVTGARLLSVAGDGDRLAIAGPGYAALKRIEPGEAPGTVQLVADGFAALPEGNVESLGARADGTGAYVVMFDRVIAIDDDWRGAGSSVAPEDLGVLKTVSGDGRTVAMMERDRSLILWRIGDAPLGLTESLTKAVRGDAPLDPATFSPTTAASAGFGRSTDEVIVVEQQGPDEVIAHYLRANGKWTREEVAREEFGIGRVEMSARGLIVSGTGGEVVVHAPDGDTWKRQALFGSGWLAARAWSHDGALLLTRTEDKQFELWALNTAGMWASAGRAGEVGDAALAAFLGPEDAVATLGARGLLIWRKDAAGAWASVVADGEPRAEYDQMIVSRDGRRIAAGGPNGVRVWTLLPDGSWKSAAVSPRAARAALDDSMSLSADGKLLALTDQGELGFVMSVWSERQDGQWVRTPITARGILNPVIQISPDGSRVLATGWEGALLADIEWLSGGPRGADGAAALTLAALSAQACAMKLPGGAGSTLRMITRGDVDAAPVLQGREGEDVCAWQPAGYDGVLQMLFGWVK